MFILGHNFIVVPPSKHNSLDISDDQLCLLTQTMNTRFLLFRSFSYRQYSTVESLLLILCLTTCLEKLKLNLIHFLKVCRKQVARICFGITGNICQQNWEFKGRPISFFELVSFCWKFKSTACWVSPNGCPFCITALFGTFSRIYEKFFVNF